MTRKYLYIRRAMYEENPFDELNHYRSFSDIKKLFKLPNWLFGVIILVSTAFTVYFILFDRSNLLIIIPTGCIFLVSIVSNVVKEKHLYNQESRSQELSEQMKEYKQCVQNIVHILHRYEIDTPEKVNILRKECESVIKAHEDKYSRINHKIVEVFVGVPLGALVAGIIYMSKDVTFDAILILIIIGGIILGAAKLIKSILFYSENYFKDVNLLNIIRELQYSEEIIDKNHND